MDIARVFKVDSSSIVITRDFDLYKRTLDKEWFILNSHSEWDKCFYLEVLEFHYINYMKRIKNEL